MDIYIYITPVTSCNFASHTIAPPLTTFINHIANERSKTNYNFISQIRSFAINFFIHDMTTKVEAVIQIIESLESSVFMYLNGGYLTVKAWHGNKK